VLSISDPYPGADATEQFYSDLKYERTIDGRSTDDDRNFIFD